MFVSFRTMRSRSALLGLAGLFLFLASGQANDWPTFRGADRSAVSKETGLLQSWPTEGPKLLWDGKGAGRGYSSLAIAAGRIYTLGDGIAGTEDQDEYLRCFSEENGELLWKTKTGAPWNNGNKSYWGSRGTPTVDGELVYVVTPYGHLFCCETAGGKERWHKDFKQDFGGDKGDGWGYSESVLIDGDQLVCTPGKDKNTVVALNKVTGEEKWKTVREGDRGAGHSSIVISEIGGTRVYVQNTASGPLGIRASDGKLLWQYAVDRTTAIIPTLIVRGDLVFFVAGYGRGGALLKQVPGADGEVKIEEVYPLKSELNNRHGGVVLVGDYLYSDKDHNGTPRCVELLTGKVKWEKRGPGSGSATIAVADGCLYIQFANGQMVLAKANPEEYVELGTFKMPHSGALPSWAHPVIVNGRLYLREQDHILCYDIKSK